MSRCEVNDRTNAVDTYECAEMALACQDHLPGKKYWRDKFTPLNLSWWPNQTQLQSEVYWWSYVTWDIRFVCYTFDTTINR